MHTSPCAHLVHLTRQPRDYRDFVVPHCPVLPIASIKEGIKRGLVVHTSVVISLCVTMGAAMNIGVGSIPFTDHQEFPCIKGVAMVPPRSLRQRALGIIYNAISAVPDVHANLLASG